jgi:hypothetical protein
MYSKTGRTATALVRSLSVLGAALLVASCTSMLPWHDEPVGQEVNVVFTLEKNLVVLPSATLDGRPGRYVFSSAQPRTLLDPAFAGGAPANQTSNPTSNHTLQLNDKVSLRMTSVPVDLRNVADAIVGSDVWGAHAVTLDYHSSILSYQKEGIHPDLMTIFAFGEQPMVNVTVDGRSVAAVVDTASPDTLVLPRGSSASGRRNARVQLAGTDFGTIDVLFADVATSRIGNRLLSKFLVTIDYGKHRVGVWRDPRTAL